MTRARFTTAVGVFGLLSCACATPSQPTPSVIAPPAEPTQQPTSDPSPTPATPPTIDIPACEGSTSISDTELYCDLTGGIVIDPAAVAPLQSIRLVAFITDPADIGFLAALPSIEEISFDDGVSADLTPLLALPRLRKLTILGPAPRIGTLEGLSTLTHLDLTHATLPDLRPLSTNTNLVDLVMLWTDVPDISPIGAFTKLEQLQLQPPSPPNHDGVIFDPHWRRRRDSLDFLVDLGRLEDASFHNLLLEDGCRALKNAPSLRMLILENSGPCDSFDVLSGLENLEYADLSRSGFVDKKISRLTSVPALEIIALTGTGVDDLAALAGLPSLRFLHFEPKTARQRRSVETLQRLKPELEILR